MKRIACLIVVAFVVTAACSKSGTESASGKGGDVVVKVGDKTITAKQIDKFLEAMPPQMRSRYTPDRIRQDIIDGFVSMELLAQEARRRGIDKREDVKLRMELMQDQILAREVEQELKKSIKVDEAELRQYYEQNRERYEAQKRYRARRITVPTEKLAKEVLARIKKGEDFSEIAKQVSTDEFAPRGGYMGILKTSNAPADIRQMLESLKEGEVSRPLKTETGYVIFRMDRITDVPERPFEQVKSSIERNLMREKLAKAVADLKEELKKKTKVEINEAFLSKYGKQEGAAPQVPDIKVEPPEGPGAGPDAPDGMGD